MSYVSSKSMYGVCYCRNQCILLNFDEIEEVEGEAEGTRNFKAWHSGPIRGYICRKFIFDKMLGAYGIFGNGIGIRPIIKNCTKLGLIESDLSFCFSNQNKKGLKCQKFTILELFGEGISKY